MEQDTENATVYDFVHPGHKLNKQWPVLELVNGRVASAFGHLLADRLQIALHGDAKHTARSKYSDTVTALSPTVVVHELSLSPLTGVAWFCMDTSVISAIVDCYFGGDGEVHAVPTPRELSRTEQRVVQLILDSLLAGMKEGWSMLLPLNAALIRPIDIDRLANAGREQVLVTSELMLSRGETELPCQLIYPFEMLEPLSEQLEREVRSNRQQDKQFSSAMQRELMNCELDIRGVLSETRITLGKLLELKPGDFIPLRDIQTVSFKTQNMPLFDARVGNSNGRVSARVSRWHLPATT